MGCWCATAIRWASPGTNHSQQTATHDYAGQLSHMRSFAGRSAAHAVFSKTLSAFKDALADKLPPQPIVSGGSTGSMSLDLVGRLTEVQCGTYAQMDVEYLEIESGWDVWPFESALRVQSSVLSAHWPNHAITDAGDKWFASKYGANPKVVSGACDTALFEPISDEHARVVVDADNPMRPGNRIECVPPHCDPNVNLYAALHIFDQDRLVDIWPIAARGS